MANYATLKSAIEQVIKTNGNNEITGALLQQSLLAMINTLGAGYQFVGIATPTTNPGTPDYNVFYIASTAGTYSNFPDSNNVPLVLNDGEIAILKYNGTWTKDVTGAATAGKVTQLGQAVDGLTTDVGRIKEELFDEEISFVDIPSLSDMTGVVINKATGVIASVQDQTGLRYFPVLKDVRYKVILSALYSNAAYQVISFCTSTPSIGVNTTAVLTIDSSANLTQEVLYTPSQDGYLLVTYVLSVQKNQISAQKEQVIINDKFVHADEVYDANPFYERVDYSQKIPHLIVRASDNQILSAGDDTNGILVFPVVASRKYRISLNGVYCNTFYLTLSFSANTPAANVVVTPIWNPESSSTNTKDIDYTPSVDGYIIAFYSSEFYSTKFSVADITPLSVFKSKSLWKGIKWAVIGDSLTEHNNKAKKNYQDYISEWTGVIPQNLGVGGTGYANPSSLNSRFYDRVQNIQEDADIVTIFGSFNDMSAGLSLGNITDTGFSTICGCINETISAIQSSFPLAGLGIITPTPWSTRRPTASGDSSSEDYVNAIVDICKLRSIPCLDLFHNSNLRPWDSSFLQVAYRRDGTYVASNEETTGAFQITEDILYYVRDYGGLPTAQVGDWVTANLAGTHPDEKGQEIIAPRIKAFLESIIKR